MNGSHWFWKSTLISLWFLKYEWYLCNNSFYISEQCLMSHQFVWCLEEFQFCQKRRVKRATNKKEKNCQMEFRWSWKQKYVRSPPSALCNQENRFLLPESWPAKNSKSLIVSTKKASWVRKFQRSLIASKSTAKAKIWNFLEVIEVQSMFKKWANLNYACSPNVQRMVKPTILQ